MHFCKFDFFINSEVFEFIEKNKNNLKSIYAIFRLI